VHGAGEGAVGRVAGRGDDEVADAVARYSNAPASVALPCCGCDTTTSTNVPPVPAGVSQRSEVASTTTMFVASWPPKLTE
jgi:hypothetical protein